MCIRDSRCLSDIQLPVTGNYVLHSKLSTKEVEDDEIISIQPDQSHLDLSQYIYEMICLSLPLTNVYDCENEMPRICDDAVLTKLASNDNAKEADKPDTNVWQNLKGLIEDN